MPIHVGIERRKREPPELHRVAVLVFLNNNVGARFLVFQFNLVAHELDTLALRWIGRIGGNSEQTDFGSFFATNHLDHFVQAPVAKSDKLIFSLTASSDSIANF